MWPVPNLFCFHHYNLSIYSSETPWVGHLWKKPTPTSKWSTTRKLRRRNWSWSICTRNGKQQSCIPEHASTLPSWCGPWSLSDTRTRPEVLWFPSPPSEKTLATPTKRSTFWTETGSLPFRAGPMRPLCLALSSLRHLLTVWAASTWSGLLWPWRLPSLVSSTLPPPSKCSSLESSWTPSAWVSSKHWVRLTLQSWPHWPWEV